MYDEAITLAETWIASGKELTEAQQSAMDTALKDAKDNRAKLKRKMGR